MQLMAPLTIPTEHRPALRHTTMEGRLDAALLTMEVVQTWRNDGSEDMEAVYTLPLPVDAVVLEVSARIGERRFQGRVVARDEAEAGYEDAVTEGDSAALVRRVAPGLYHLSLGNLRPGEEAEIRYRYADLPRWHQDHLRIALPTTLAPRYGDPAAAGLQAHETPETSLEVTHPLDLRLRVHGPLARAVATCPTHPLHLDRDGDDLILAIEGTVMDRDVVLELRLPQERHDLIQLARDGDGYVALAALHPHLSAGDRHARNLKIVIDCSGSMGGDAIAQARAGLNAVLDALEPDDHFNLIRFGSTVEPLFPHQVPARDPWLRQARALVEHLDADLGGTDLISALRTAYQSAGGEGPAEVILITDGEVWDDGTLTREAKTSGQRIFPVGLGAAGAHDIVLDLARASGGQAEFVTPNEDLAAAIERQFHRLRAPRAQVHPHWPSHPTVEHPQAPVTAFDGDTLFLFAWFDERPRGELELHWHTDDGQVRRQALPLPETIDKTDTLGRIACARRLPDLEAKDPETARRLAVEKQLLATDTALLLTLERAEGEKADGLPRLHREPHMLAAGWGGMGTVRYSSSRTTDLHEFQSLPTLTYHSPRREQRIVRRKGIDIWNRLDSDDLQDLHLVEHLAGPQIARLMALITATDRPTLDLLDREGLIHGDLYQALYDLMQEGEDETALVAALAWAFLTDEAGRRLPRDLRMHLIWRAKQLGATRALRDRIRSLLQSILPA